MFRKMHPSSSARKCRAGTKSIPIASSQLRRLLFSPLHLGTHDGTESYKPCRSDKTQDKSLWLWLFLCCKACQGFGVHFRRNPKTSNAAEEVESCRIGRGGIRRAS
jgi:hypothetical protein